MRRPWRQRPIPAFGELSARKLHALGAKLDALLDPAGYAHSDLLWKHTSEARRLLWHLVRHGLVLQKPRSAGLVRLVCEGVDAAAPAELIAALRRLPADMGALDRGAARTATMLTPGVLAEVDGLLVAAYCTDRAALVAARDDLPDSLKLAIDFVRRRAGEPIDPAASAAILRQLAIQHCERGLAGGLDVPRIAGGARTSARLDTDEDVAALARLFGPPDAWAGSLATWLLAHVRKFRGEADALSERALPGLRRVQLAELAYLFGDGWWRAPAVLRALDARGDAPAALFAVGTMLVASGTGTFRVITPQVVEVQRRIERSFDEDDFDGYDEFEEAPLDDDAVEAGGGDERVRALAEIFAVVGVERAQRAGQAIPIEVDALFDLRRVFDSDVEYVPRLRAALAGLGPARAHAVIRRIASREFFAGKAAAIADVHFEPGLFEHVLARINASAQGVEAGLLGFCGPATVPLIAAAQAADPGHAEACGEAILYVLARAAAAGHDIEAAHDRHVQLDRIRFHLGAERVAPVLAMLDTLPAERHAQIVAANLRRCALEPWRLVHALRPDTPVELLATVLAAVVARRSTLDPGALGERLRRLGTAVVEPLTAVLGDWPVDTGFLRELERALSPAAFIALKARLRQANATSEQELRRLAASVPGPKVRIYLLCRGDGPPAADEVGRIGGAPRGVTPAEVPTLDGEPMAHVLTLDLARLPELAARRPEARAVSLYLPDPRVGERHGLGRLVWTVPEALDRAPGSTVGASTLVAEPLDVPTVVFEGGELDGAAQRVRLLVYQSNGHALGGPLWLQDGPDGVDPAFVAQFDDGLCDVHLGDVGVMYVFDRMITWQSH
jgi:hypothetical protein